MELNKMEENKMCLLCLSHHCDGMIPIQETRIGYDILQEVIRQHFWFEFNDTQNYPNTVCTPCCLKVSNFHEYYLYVKSAHGTYNNTAMVKNEAMEYLDVKCDKELPIKGEQVMGDDEDLPFDDVDRLSYDAAQSSSDNEEEEEEEEVIKERKHKVKKTKIKKEVKETVDKKLSARSKRQHSKQILEEQRDKIREIFTMNCELCETRFHSLDDARHHYRTEHNQAGYLICCGKRYKYAFRVVQHLRYHENPDEFKCPTCSKTFIDKKSLLGHMEIHVPESERLFKCEYCSRSYTKQIALKNHLNASHPNGNLKPLKTFECKDCDRKFSYKTSLRTHINNVHRNRNLKMCDICAKIFKSLYAYEFHYKVMHTDEMKRVQCDTCGIWLKHSESLRKHKKETCFDKEKSETCTVCGKISPNRKALQAHIRRVHNSHNISFPCKICGKIFKRTTTLREHMAIHTGETLYTCAFCTKTFRSHANMYKHYKHSHPVEYEQRKAANLGLIKYV